MKKYGIKNYEYLEFLGDAILKSIVTIMILRYTTFTDPGMLTQFIQRFLSNKFFDRLMKDKDLCKYIKKKGVKVCADVFEALIGALYIYLTEDKGMEYDAFNYIEKWLRDFWDFPSYIYETTNVWSDWSDWSECQNGKMFRRRVCKSIECEGPQREEKVCDKTKEWSEWTKWSPCEENLQSRTRQCLGKGCEGPFKDIRDCELYSDWGEWEPCEYGKEWRYRKCLSSDCKRPLSEYRPCKYKPK